MTSRTFIWLTTNGGAWALASNWNDTTDHLNPSLIAPGAQDSVTVTGPSGAHIQTITGAGAASAALFAGNSILAGAFQFGDVSLGQAGSGGLLQVAAGGSVQSASATLASGSLIASGAASIFSVSGTLTIGAGQAGLGAPTATLDATSGGYVQSLALLLDASSSHIYVDPVSIIEIGTAGTGVAGQLTIDAGATLSGQGDANAYAATTNNGTIEAAGGTLTVGNVAGTGTMAIDAGATLELNGTAGAGQSIVFAGASATLALAAEFYAPAGIVTGFGPGDLIDVLGSPITGAFYAATGQNLGVLTLTYAGQVAAQIILAGDYTANNFLTSRDGTGGTLIAVSASVSGNGGASPGTQTADVYIWTAKNSGAWNSAANWRDATTGASPAAIAPGANNLVSIAAPQDAFIAIGGPANAASLSITGDLALTGVFSAGTLSLGDTGAALSGTLDLLAGASFSARTASVAWGDISVAGATTTFSVAGTLVLGGGPSGVGLPTAGIQAVEGGKVTLAGLSMGGGSGAFVSTDLTGRIEIGGAGGAAAGAVTVDAGATLSGNGQLNPYGRIVDNGSILATGGSLTVGGVTGSGTLAIDTNATLCLNQATALGIFVAGANATLTLSSEAAAPTGAISGFSAGDVIDVLGNVITSASFAKTSDGGILTLLYGTLVAARLNFLGDFTNQRFAVQPDGAGGTDITVVQITGGGGGGGTGTDTLAWAVPGSGAWGNAANWNDLTTGQPATASPGSQNTVRIAGPTDASFQAITGSGPCDSLAFSGNTLLNGTFSANTLTVGFDGTGGTLDVGTSAVLTASEATVADGVLEAVGLAASVAIAGTLSLAGAGAEALLAAQSRASIQLGGLTLGAGSQVTTDTTGWIEIGTAGGATAGAVTIDDSILVAGSGSLNTAGWVIDNGEVRAIGGTLMIGQTSGLGTLSIGTEAILSLASADQCPIVFAGGGGTLMLPGSANLPQAVIAGFAPGDSVVIAGSQIGAVSYLAGSFGIGTLTLFQGGAVAGVLRLAGDYGANSFAVQPGPDGAVITVQGPGGGGPSSGTTTPDAYVWTGAVNGDWNFAANWSDTTAGQNPALVAPGHNNLVSIQGGAGGTYLTIGGPADAASLSLSGNVALSATYAIGGLSVGGNLALGMDAFVAAASVDIAGGLLAGGGTLSVDGILALESGAVLAASGASLIQATFLTLGGAGSAIATDSTASLEIGTTGNAAAGAVTIDQGFALAGAGSINLAGQIFDNGTLTATGGILALGAVSGSGTLLITDGATLVLDQTAGASLIIDFAGAGTLSVAGGAMPEAAIADFGASDSILLPFGATSASYAATGAGIGVLTLLSGDEELARLTLLGQAASASFVVAGTAGGGTLLTTTPDNMSGGGGSDMGKTPQDGAQDPATFIASLPSYARSWLSQALVDPVSNSTTTPWVSVSPDGTGFETAALPGVYDYVAIATAPAQGTVLLLPANYLALIAEGNAAVQLSDPGAGHAVLIGNGGRDTITSGVPGAFAVSGDTLVGGAGASSLFVTTGDATVQGGGNDTVVANGGFGNATVLTSTGSSVVYLGTTSLNFVTSNGHDLIVCDTIGSGARDTIDALHGVGQGSDTVFGPNGRSALTFIGGGSASTIVGGTGNLAMYGGSGNGSVLWAGSGFTLYEGGSGSAVVVGGVGDTQVDGGAGAMTVYAGTGTGVFTGGPGPSVFVVGSGASTVLAASGNTVWIGGSAPVSVAAAGGGVQAWGSGATGNEIFQGAAGNDTFAGGHGNDLFLTGSGTEILFGGGGADIFSFTNGLSGGADVIFGFDPATCRIALHGYPTNAAAVLAAETVSGGNTQLTLPDGTSISLIGVTNLTTSSFAG